MGFFFFYFNTTASSPLPLPVIAAVLSKHIQEHVIVNKKKSHLGAGCFKCQCCGSFNRAIRVALREECAKKEKKQPDPLSLMYTFTPLLVVLKGRLGDEIRISSYRKQKGFIFFWVYCHRCFTTREGKSRDDKKR